MFTQLTHPSIVWDKLGYKCAWSNVQKYLFPTCDCDDRGQDRCVLHNKWFDRSGGFHRPSWSQTTWTSLGWTQSNALLMSDPHKVFANEGRVFLPGVLETSLPLGFTFTPGSYVLRVWGEESHSPAAGDVIRRHQASTYLCKINVRYLFGYCQTLLLAAFLWSLVTYCSLAIIVSRCSILSGIPRSYFVGKAMNYQYTLLRGPLFYIIHPVNMNI